MKRFTWLAAVLGAVMAFGGASQANAGGFGIGFGVGSGGMYPYGGLGGMYGGYPGIGYPSYGVGNSLGVSVYRNNNSAARRYTATSTPAKSYDGKPIMIVCPADAAAPLAYKLNGQDFVINPGESQSLKNDRDWVIAFDRGGDFGTARYTMSAGTYRFQVTGDHGWDLFHSADGSTQSTGGVVKNALPK